MLGLLLASTIALSSPLTLLDESLQFDPSPRLSLSLPSATGGPVPAVLGLFVVGLGQVVNGEPVKGVATFLGAAFLGGVGLGLAQVGPDQRPSGATYLGLGMIGAFVVLYAWSVWDAWTGGGTDGSDEDQPVGMAQMRPGVSFP